MAVGAVLLAVGLAGCQVSTTVAVRVGGGGGGTVTVVVVFDQAATEAVGGVSGALQAADLQAAGWTVTSASSAAGSTTVTLTHSFARTAQVPALLAEVGRSPTGAHLSLFTLDLAQTRTFFSTTTTAAGEVDLTCGLSCFGDAGLQRAYGSELGVDPAELRTPAGRSLLERDFPFAFDLELPGHVTSSDGGPGPAGSGLQWDPGLGRAIPVTATATAVDPVRVTEASAAGGATIIGFGVVIVVVALPALGLRRRRSRGRSRPGPA